MCFISVYDGQVAYLLVGMSMKQYVNIVLLRQQRNHINAYHLINTDLNVMSDSSKESSRRVLIANFVWWLVKRRYACESINRLW
jgi:hypothetical protein